MFNIACIFEDANRAANFFDRLRILPLPAAVYMMQVDVINHYRYALDHYFTLQLDARCLQNSSLGTPYQKWAFFVNKEFDALAFTIKHLMRYTCRLTEDSECLKLGSEHRISEAMRAGDKYIGALVEMTYGKSIGIRVLEDNALSLSRLRTEPLPGQIITRLTGSGSYETVLITTDSSGTSQERRITPEEDRRLTEDIKSERIETGDRSILFKLCERGQAEISVLDKLNQQFAESVNAFYRSKDVAAPYRFRLREGCCEDSQR